MIRIEITSQEPVKPEHIDRIMRCAAEISDAGQAVHLVVVVTLAAENAQPEPQENPFEVDWRGAPEWATHHAFDQDGRGYFFGCKPASGSSNFWPRDGENHRCLLSGFTLPKNLCDRWQESVTERPQVAATITRS